MLAVTVGKYLLLTKYELPPPKSTCVLTVDNGSGVQTYSAKETSNNGIAVSAQGSTIVQSPATLPATGGHTHNTQVTHTGNLSVTLGTTTYTVKDGCALLGNDSSGVPIWICG